MKRSLFAVAFCAIAASVSAQGLKWIDGGLPVALYEPGFESRDSTSAIRGLPMYGFLNGREFPASTSIANVDLAPLETSLTFTSVSARSTSSSPRMADNSQDVASEVPTTKNDPIYYGGELGVFYGHSVGSKRSGDEFGSYLVGTVGNEHMQINVGASYQESSFRVPTRVIR